VTTNPNPRGDHLQLLADFLPHAYQRLPAGALFVLLTDVVNGHDSGELAGKGLPSAFAPTVGSNLHALLIRALRGLPQEDLLGLVEQQKLPSVFLAELLRPTAEDPPPQQLDLLEMLQGFVLVLNLRRAFGLQRGRQLTDQLLQFLNAPW
jgi:hypothetical protein